MSAEPAKRLTKAQARELTDRIRADLTALWEMVRLAYQRRADIALGYSDWDAYCRAEFSGLWLQLPRESRSRFTCSLRAAGLPTRAIASAAGVSQSTISRDIDQLSQNGTVELPATVVSLDGRERPSSATVVTLPVEFVRPSPLNPSWRARADIAARDTCRALDKWARVVAEEHEPDELTERRMRGLIPGCLDTLDAIADQLET